MCFESELAHLKPFPHTEHKFGLPITFRSSPVCFFICFDKFELSANDIWHSWHVCGLMGLWILRCLFSTLLSPNTLWHSGHSNEFLFTFLFSSFVAEDSKDLLEWEDCSCSSSSSFDAKMRLHITQFRLVSLSVSHCNSPVDKISSIKFEVIFLPSASFSTVGISSGEVRIE